MVEMQTKSDAQLLRDYAARGDEAAFREIVTRHTDFVYSAAHRQVESAAVAADLAQGVFTDLAHKARPVSEKISNESSLAGWLHRSTRYAALNHLRDSHRRRTNERLAMEQLLTNSESAADWEQIRPALDEALDSLSNDDREALLLRYFKNQDFRAVGRALGMSDDAAQKRVSRAVERLREFFSKRNVTMGASGLAVVISANAVQAAPVGLAVTISAAALAGATVSASTAIAVTKTIAMTTLQKALITATLAAAIGTGIYQAHRAVQLREQVQTLQQQQAPLAEQIWQLQRANDDATNRLALMAEEIAKTKSNNLELLKLRAQVTSLLQSNHELTTLANPPATSTNEGSSIVDMGNYAIPDTWSNAGLDTATDAVRTYLWSLANTNTTKLKEVLSLPADSKEMFAGFVQKEGMNLSEAIKGARIVSAKQISDDRNECLFIVESLNASPATTESGDPRPPSSSLETQSLIVRRINGVWHVAFPGLPELSPEELEKYPSEAAKKSDSDIQQ